MIPFIRLALIKSPISFNQTNFWRLSESFVMSFKDFIFYPCTTNEIDWFILQSDTRVYHQDVNLASCRAVHSFSYIWVRVYQNGCLCAFELECVRVILHITYRVSIAYNPINNTQMDYQILLSTKWCLECIV